jgi:hemerythrin superfamily protein
MKEKPVKLSTGQRLPAGQQSKPAMTRGERNVDAIALLKADHREVADLIEEFEEADHEEKAQLARQICDALKVHAQIEEEILYPEAREALDEEDRELVNEADVEHASVRQLVAEIEGATPEDEHFDARVKVVGEYVRHHVKEEEKELFPKLKEADIDLDEMGARLAARKAELMSQQPDAAPAAH